MTRAFAQGDVAAIVDEFYADDAWVLGRVDQTWKGGAGMTALYAPLVGRYAWSYTRQAIVPIGADGAVESMVGTITPVDPAEETLAYKIQFTWVRRDGRWACLSQFFDFGTDFAPQT